MLGMGSSGSTRRWENEGHPFAMRFLNLNCEKWACILDPLGERQRGAVLNAAYLFSQTGETVEPKGREAAMAFLAMLPDLRRARAKAMRSARKDNKSV